MMNSDCLLEICLLDYICLQMFNNDVHRMIGVSFHKLLIIIAFGVCLFYFGWPRIGDQDNVRIRFRNDRVFF